VLVAASLTLAGASGCAAPDGDAPEEDVASVEESILGGEVERGWPAVGMLRFASGGFGTGTLLAPNVVLTAAHVAGGNPTHFFYGEAPEGKTPSYQNLRSVKVAEIVIHPCYQLPKPSSCLGPAREAIDVAMIRLETPITDVTPLKIVDWPLETFWGWLSPYEGEHCTAVGFGAHITADRKVAMTTRRSAISKVASIDETELVTVRVSGIASSGDSGGPLVCAGRIIGTVRGSAAPVPKTSPFERKREAYERTDLSRDWIKTYMRRWTTPRTTRR
jgi:hypothetical protein